VGVVEAGNHWAKDPVVVHRKPLSKEDRFNKDDP